MKASRLPGIRRFFVILGVLILIGGIVGGALLGLLTVTLEVTVFVLLLYSGFSFVIWRVIRGRVLETVQAEIEDMRQLIHSYKHDLPLTRELFETAQQEMESGNLVKAEALLTTADQLPESEHPIRAFLTHAQQDGSAAGDALSSDYLRGLETALDQLSGYDPDDLESVPSELDRIYDNLIEQELALCHILSSDLVALDSESNPETRADLWENIADQSALLAELADAALVPPPEAYPRYGNEFGDAADAVDARGCRTSETTVEPSVYDQMVSDIEKAIGSFPETDLFRYVTVYARMESCRADINVAERLLADGDGFESQERYRETTRRLDTVHNEAVNRGFTTLVEEIETLHSEAKDGRKRAYATVSGRPSSSESGPQGPNASETIKVEGSQRPSGEVSESLQAELPDHDILDHLGSGGNADVHRVRLEESGDIAALKVPQWQGTLSQSVVENFVEEARTWDQLDDHDYIITLRDFGINPYPWMLLEFMDRGNLADQMESISPTRGIKALVNVCNAAHYAHQHGVAHTDIKPENIMFTTTDDGVNVKIGDWGLAQVMLEHSKSVEGMTPSYAAPEQVDPDTYGSTGPKTDIYQLGVTAYELLTGQVPYEYDAAAAVMNAIVSKAPTPPSERREQLGPAVDEVVMTAMETSQADRYESVLYFRDALSDLIS